MPPKTLKSKTIVKEKPQEVVEPVPDKNNDRIVLNVGGKKYETFRKTLLQYPDTLLGTIFQDGNKDQLPPVTNGNEYFLDRDGYAFRYIIQFYRLGKILFPTEENRISREALQAEIDYFMLPVGIDDLALSKAGKKAISKVDEFIHALERIFYELVEHFEGSVKLVFSEPDELEIEGVQKHLVAKLKDILNPFQSYAMFILARCGKEVGVYLRENVPELSWQMEFKQDKTQSKQVYEIHMDVQRNLLDGAIFKHSLLGKATAVAQ
ncbi:4461_t:CDS:2 [Paraglomus occultum]|uniref:4461_t:CDS:1 n=1 Tax=Paraglomus occultum TaxID=144539 RepID=A0A9N9G4X9_9GLOM|nr:4461_t:CDS:2 [Paraglomus occultum]